MKLALINAFLSYASDLNSGSLEKSLKVTLMTELEPVRNVFCMVIINPHLTSFKIKNERSQ